MAESAKPIRQNQREGFTPKGVSCKVEYGVSGLQLLGRIRGLFSLEAVILAIMFPLAYGGEWSQILPFSFKALFVFVAILLISFYLLNERARNTVQYYKVSALYLVFVLYCVASNVWSEGSVYATDKSLSLLSSDILLYFLCSFAFFRKNASDKMSMAALVLTVLTLVHIYQVLSTTPLELEERIGRYQFISLTLGTLASVLIAAVLFGRNHLAIQSAYMGASAAAMVGVVMSSGRGGILVFLAAMVVFAIILLRPVKYHLLILDRRRVFFLLTVGAAASAVFWALIALDNIPASIYRLIAPSDDISSADGRWMLLLSALEIWSQYPIFGAGNGAFPVLAGLGDQQGYYPHNIFVELLAEYGVVGVGLFGSLLVASLRLYYRTIDRVEDLDQLLPLLLFLLALTTSMVIGDISSSLLHCGLGMLVSRSWQMRYSRPREQITASLNYQF